MPRSRSGSRSASPRMRSSSPRSYGASRTGTVAQPPPTLHHPSPPMRRPIMGSGGMGDALMTGFGIGAGSEVGHQLVGGMFGGRRMEQAPVNQTQQPVQPYGASDQTQSQQQMQQKDQPCQTEALQLAECLKTHDDIVMCQPRADVLKECTKKHNIRQV